MKLEKTIDLGEQDVEVSISFEDIVAAIAEDTSAVHTTQRGLTNCYHFMRAIPAEIIAQMTPQARSTILNALSEQLKRFAPPADPSVIETHGLDTQTEVFFYEQDFYVLSNFSAFAIYWSGHRFETSEHLYHWLKFPDFPNIRAAILGASSAHEAFKIAERERNSRREDWDRKKVGIMRSILRAKAAQHEYVRRKLLATGDRILIENSWRDPFWGWGPHRDGKNMLGKLWMEIRAEIRSSTEGA